MMNWIKAENYEEMSRIGAERICLVIDGGARTGKPVRIGLATGNTMIRLYEILAEMLNRKRIPLCHLYTFNLDEYVDGRGAAVPYTHPLSYRKYMMEYFFCRLDPSLGFREENIRFPDPENPENFDRELADAGGSDLQLLGLGFNGHIAFNEPMAETEISVEDFGMLPTRIIKLREMTIATNRRLTAGGKDIVPKRAVTMGMKQILDSKRLLLLACFPEQEEALKAILRGGKVTPELPASYLLKKTDSEIVYCADCIHLECDKR